MKKLLATLVVCLLIIILTFTCFVGCKETDDNVIRLNEVTHSVFYAPLYIAINKGFFKDEGLEIELTNGGGSDTTMTALVSKSADIALAGPEASVYVYLEGKTDYAVIFAQLTRKDGSFLVGREKEEDFDWDTSLIGKEIIGGRKGGMPAMALEYALVNRGYVDGENITINYDVKFDLIVPAFESGTGDYCTMFEPAASNYEKAGKGYILGSVGEASGDVPFTSFSALKSYIEKNPEKIEKFTRALQKGMDYVWENTPETVAEAVKDSFVGTEVELLAAAIKNYKDIYAYSKTTTMKEEDFGRLIDIITDAGIIDKEVPFDKIFDNSFAVK